jgi:hypothetical protein
MQSSKISYYSPEYILLEVISMTNFKEHEVVHDPNAGFDEEQVTEITTDASGSLAFEMQDGSALIARNLSDGKIFGKKIARDGSVVRVFKTE